LPPGPAYTLFERLGFMAPGTAGAQGQGRFEDYRYKNEAYSIFGQVDFEPVDGLVFTAGGNYTHDNKTVISNTVVTDQFSALDLVKIGTQLGIPGTVAANPAFNPLLGLRPLQFIPPFLNIPNAVEDGKTSDSKFTYTLRAAYKINENLSSYVTYATGFKASSFNLSIDSRPFPTDFIPGSSAQIPAPAPSPIRTAGLALNNLTVGTRYADPENSTVYEFGLKGQWTGFSVNLAVFKQELKGFQSNIFTGTGFVLGNAEKQSTTGLEIDALMSPIKNFTVTASLTYLNPKFDKFTGGTVLQPGSFSTVPTDLTGQRPSGIPEFSYALGATYTADISETMHATFHVDYNGNSPVILAQGLNYKAEFQSLNAAISLGVGHGVELTLWGRNLANSQYLTTLFPGVAQSGSLQGYPSQPRTYGGAVRYRF
jgi:outer membrane receptor protein involved in Fe transport